MSHKKRALSKYGKTSLIEITFHNFSFLMFPQNFHTEHCRHFQKNTKNYMNYTILRACSNPPNYAAKGDTTAPLAIDARRRLARRGPYGTPDASVDGEGGRRARGRPKRAPRVAHGGRRRDLGARQTRAWPSTRPSGCEGSPSRTR